MFNVQGMANGLMLCLLLLSLLCAESRQPACAMWQSLMPAGMRSAHADDRAIPSCASVVRPQLPRAAAFGEPASAFIGQPVSPWQRRDRERCRSVARRRFLSEGFSLLGTGVMQTTRLERVVSLRNNIEADGSERRKRTSPAASRARWNSGSRGREGEKPGTTRAYNSVLQRLARDGDMVACNKVLKEMDAKGLAWDVFTYNAVLNCQSKARSMPSSEPVRLLAKMAEDKVVPNVVTLNTALKFYARRPRLEPALDLLHSMQGQGVSADAITYNTLLNICCKGGLMARAELVLEEMRSAGMQPTASTMTTLIMGYGRVGEIAKAEHVATLLPAEPSVMRCLATVLVDNNAASRAFPLLQPLFGIPLEEGPNGRGAVQVESADGPDDGCVQGRKEESETINTALMALRADHQVKSSVELVTRGLEQGWAMDTVTLNTFLDTVCVVGAQPLVAIPVLSLLVRRSLGAAQAGSMLAGPDEHAAREGAGSAASQGGSEGEEGEEGEELAQLAIALANCVLTQGEQLAQRQGAEGRGGRDAERRWNEEVVGSVRRIATSFIRAYSRIEQEQEAGQRNRADEREEAGGEGGRGARGTGGMEISKDVGHARSSIGTSLQMLEDLWDVGCEADEVLLTAAVDACALACDVDAASALIRKAEEQWRLPPSVAAYNALLKTVRNAGGEGATAACERILAEMAAVEIAADVVSFNTVLQVVLDDRSQEVGQAGGGLEREGGRDRNAEGVGEDAEVGYEREEERILEVMQASGVAPDVNTYNARIKAATRRRNHAKVLRLFKQMQATARGVAPATATPEKSAAARARAAAVAGATATAAQHEESRGAGRGSNGSVKANDMTFALVAESCGLVGEVKLVKEMLQRIGPQAPSEALRIGYSALVRAHAVQGLPNKALEVALRARQVGIEVLEGSWYALLDSWAEIGDLEMVQRALGEMEGAGVRLNHIHWSIAIKASCRSGDARACKTALALLRTHIRHPDVVCFNTIISAALKTRDIDSLVIALREMEQCGVEPDHFTRQVLESAGSSAAMLKVGSILGTFNSRFRNRLADAVFPN